MAVDSWACYIEPLLQFGVTFEESSIHPYNYLLDLRPNIPSEDVCGSLLSHAVSYDISIEWSNSGFLFLNWNFSRYVSANTRMQFHQKTFHQQPPVTVWKQ